MSVYDLHLHSSYSDGDLDPRQIIEELLKRGVSGFSLTDHNGIWGVDEAAAGAREHGLDFIEGIEISARHNDYDLHILGYSKKFNRDVLHRGLRPTRDGYLERMDQMVWQCQQAGYDDITMDSIKAGRGHMKSPVYVSYDLAKLIKERYRISVEDARSLTTTGGVCHVPYGDWAMSPDEAISLIHESGGLAVWAHAGVMTRDRGIDTLRSFMSDMMEAGIDGLELFHPVHGQDELSLLRDFVADNQLLVTGGSDWHGPDRYQDSDLLFGDIGSSEVDWKALLAKMI